MDPKKLPEPLRRRGKVLEDALLGAAWEQLVEGGYALFTIDAVAERAGTSRPVLYRRWPSREDLVVAAIRHRDAQEARAVPDTGSLRGDVLELMQAANETRMAFMAIFSAKMGAYYSETGTAPADLRRELLGSRPSAVDAVYRRAVDRGEVEPARLTPRIAALPFDLLRQEVLMTLRAVPEEAILSIVDEVFLPLVLKR